MAFLDFKIEGAHWIHAKRECLTDEPNLKDGGPLLTHRFHLKYVCKRAYDGLKLLDNRFPRPSHNLAFEISEGPINRPTPHNVSLPNALGTDQSEKRSFENLRTKQSTFPPIYVSYRSPADRSKSPLEVCAIDAVTHTVNKFTSD